MAVSERMAGVRQKGTSLELHTASVLRDLGIAYRKNVRSLPGSPDFANKKRRWAIFVNGCFWHHHKGCRKATIPKTNSAFWETKFAANRRRDATAIRALRAKGYRVVILWGCSPPEGDRLCQALEAGRIKPR